MRTRAVPFLAAAFLAVFPLSGARAAPQILALMETPAAVPLVCAGGVCAAPFSTLCLQKDRDTPRPGAVYHAAPEGGMTLILTAADGRVVRVPAAGRVAITVPRSFAAVAISVAEADMRALGAATVAVEVAPLVSLVPEAEADDPWPLASAEIARATGPLRAAAAAIAAGRAATVVAAGTANRMLARLRLETPATDEARQALWRRVAASAPEGPTHPGVVKAGRMVERCSFFSDTGAPGELGGCLETLHDSLMFGLTGTYWNRGEAGS